MKKQVVLRVAKFPPRLAFDVSRRCLLSEKARQSLGLKPRGDAIIISFGKRHMHLWAYQGEIERREELLVYLNPPSRDELGIGDEAMNDKNRPPLVIVRRASCLEKLWLRFKIEKGYDFVQGILVGVVASIIVWLIFYVASRIARD